MNSRPDFLELTMPRRATYSLMILLGLIALTPLFLAGDGDPAPQGNALQRAVVDPDFPSRDEQGRIAVWVFFEKRSLSAADLESALVSAESNLPKRTIQRRAKVLAPGARAVDERDLPVDPSFIAQVTETGASLRRTSRWLHAASVQVHPSGLDDLAALDCVRKLDLVAAFQRTAIPTPIPDSDRDAVRPQAKSTAWTLDYGENLAAMEQANVPAVHEMGLNGAGVIVGMLDTGFRVTHESLAGIPVLGAYDFVNDDAIVDQEETDPWNAILHGTETLSTLAGYRPGELIAPAYGVSVILAKTEDVADELPVEEDYYVVGLEWLEAQGADIISSSLGYYDWYTQADLDGETCVTTIAVDQAVGRGVVVVTAAGNEGSSDWGTLIAPADADSAITVGAVRADSTVAYFSSPGPTADGRLKPEVAALGYQNRVANPFEDLEYVNSSGTSFSCPLVSGVVALILQRTPQLTPMQVRAALMMTAGQADHPDTSLGWGIVNAYEAVEYFGPKFVHVPLENTADQSGPYTVTAQISDVVAVDPAQVVLRYRVNSGPWTQHLMTDLGGGQFSFDIPGQSYTSIVDYIIEAASVNGVIRQEPDVLLPDDFHNFAVTGSSPVDCLCNQDLPEPTSLKGAAPNPFNPRTQISFVIGKAGRARLDVFDMKGRLVRNLLNETLEPGPHSQMWNGRDDTGQEVGSGVYLYRLQTVDTELRGKLMLVR